MARNGKIDRALLALDYSLTPEVVADAPGTYQDLAQLIGTRGWEESLGFSEADLAAYFAEIALERSLA